jgi:hypothetical protein
LHSCLWVTSDGLAGRSGRQQFCWCKVLYLLAHTCQRHVSTNNSGWAGQLSLKATSIILLTSQA